MRARRLLLYLAAFGLVTLSAGTLGTFVLQQRLERIVTEALRHSGPQHIRAEPLRGRVTIQPFEWAHPGSNLSVKAHSMTLRIGLREAVAAVAAPERLRRSRLQAELDRAIADSDPGEELLYATHAEIQLQGTFPLSSEADYRVERLLLHGTHVHGTVFLPRGLGSIVLSVPAGREGPDRVTALEWDRDRTGEGERLQLELEQFRYVPGPELLRELDSRREGISRLLPAEGVFLDRMALALRQDGEVLILEHLEVEGPGLLMEAHGRGTLSGALQLEELSGRLTVHRLDSPARSALLPFVYVMTDGTLPPREGPFSLSFTPDPAPEGEESRGWSTRATLE